MFGVIVLVFMLQAVGILEYLLLTTGLKTSADMIIKTHSYSIDKCWKDSYMSRHINTSIWSICFPDIALANCWGFRRLRSQWRRFI